VTKHIVDTALCEVCGQHDETADHIIAGCPFARTFWAKLDFNLPLDCSTFLDDLHCIGRLASVPSKHFSTFIALCCWQLWKRRNNVIFQSELASTRQTLVACIADTKLWRTRLPRKDRAVADAWIGAFLAAMQ
jgi:uncharacterized RDD family membrane protein YckC